MPTSEARANRSIILSVLGLLGIALFVVPAIYGHYRISSLFYRQQPPTIAELNQLGLIALVGDIGVAVSALSAVTGFLYMAGVKPVKILGAILLISAVLLSFGNPLIYGIAPTNVPRLGVSVVDKNALFSGDFIPRSIRVVLGVNSTVTWTVDANSLHPDVIVSDDGLFNSGLIQQGQSWSYTFTKPGIYSYHSAIHGWMHGTVEVIAP